MPFRDLLHAANLRHETDSFTSPPKEGVLRIFFLPLKIRRLRPGLNPRTWVPKASTLPLDNQSIYGAKKLLPIKIFHQQYETENVTIDFTQATSKCKHHTNNAITPPTIRRAVIMLIHMYYGPITYCYTYRQTQFKLPPL